MEQEPADAEVVRQVLGGNVDAYGVLVRRYRERYARFAVRMLGNREDAEDALQEALVRAYRGLGRLDDPGRFGPWLLSILANRCRTAGRRRTRRDRTFVPAEAGGGEPEVAPDVENAAWREEIAAALEELSPDQREAFLLHYVEGLDYEAIAQATGAGISALKMRVKRARERLAKRLEGVRS